VKDQATAYHEAGHAVAAFYVERAFTNISIEEDEDSFGRVIRRAPGEWFRPDAEVDGRTRRRIEQDIMIGLAGPLAEERFTGTSNDAGAGLIMPEGMDVGILLPGSDLQRVVDLSLYVSGGGDDEASAFVEWLRQRTLSLLNQHWPSRSLEELAAQLLVDRTLSWKRAKQVIQKPFELEMDKRRGVHSKVASAAHLLHAENELQESEHEKGS